MFVCAPQDLSSFAMPFLEGDAEHVNKDGVRKVTQPKHAQGWGNSKHSFVQFWNQSLLWKTFFNVCVYVCLLVL